jgi:hypothetical protein
MAPLNAAVALTASADMNVELAVNGLARDLNLELLGDVCLVEGAEVMRALWAGETVQARRLRPGPGRRE